MVTMLEQAPNAKIISCSDPMMWYRDLVNELIYIERETVDYYWSREQNIYNCLNILHKQDVTMLPQETTT